MHYAVHMGGWVALVALVCTGALFCLSAHLILRAFDLLPPGVPRTYPELGKASAGAAWFWHVVDVPRGAGGRNGRHAAGEGYGVL